MNPMTFNDGIVQIYRVKDVSENGNMPVEGLEILYQLRYQERTVGIKRFYSAMQNNVKADMVIRVPRLRDVSTQDVAIINNQYKIRQIQYPDELPVMDLTLELLEHVYEVTP